MRWKAEMSPPPTCFTFTSIHHFSSSPSFSPSFPVRSLLAGGSPLRKMRTIGDQIRMAEPLCIGKCGWAGMNVRGKFAWRILGMSRMESVWDGRGDECGE